MSWSATAAEVWSTIVPITRVVSVRLGTLGPVDAPWQRRLGVIHVQGVETRQTGTLLCYLYIISYIVFIGLCVFIRMRSTIPGKTFYFYCHQFGSLCKPLIWEEILNKVQNMLFVLSRSNTNSQRHVLRKNNTPKAGTQVLTWDRFVGALAPHGIHVAACLHQGRARGLCHQVSVVIGHSELVTVLAGPGLTT